MTEYIEEDVERMLKEHLENKSKLKEFQFKKECNEELLRYNNREYKETEEEAIESMQLNAVTISDMPKR